MFASKDFFSGLESKATKGGLDILSIEMYIWHVQEQTAMRPASHTVTIPPHLIGDFTGSSILDVDKETGFLECADISQEMAKVRYGNGFGPLAIFNSFKKAHFINYLRDCWPNISEACRRVGISRWTVKNHLAIDQVFKECVEEIGNIVVDNIHGVRMTVAAKENGSFDRMCVLNAHMPELYNPKTVIKVEHTMSAEQARGRDSVVSKVIDAEVVSTISRAKQVKASNAR